MIAETSSSSEAIASGLTAEAAVERVLNQTRARMPRLNDAYWRERMRELMDAEGSSALRKAKLTRAFNQGYRSYSRTYNTCSPSAQTAVTRFIGEGAELSDGLLKSFAQ